MFFPQDKTCVPPFLQNFLYSFKIEKNLKGVSYGNTNLGFPQFLLFSLTATGTKGISHQIQQEQEAESRERIQH